MQTFLYVVHCCACVLLVLVVLLQAGRGAGFAIFGGGGDTLFASKGGSTALKKATIVLASTFAVTSLMLTLLSSRPGLQSVVGKKLNLPIQQQQPAPSGGEKASPNTPETPSPALPKE